MTTREPEKQHKPGCMINRSCAVIHSDGVCPGPYGKCNCDEIPNSNYVAPNSNYVDSRTLEERANEPESITTSTGEPEKCGYLIHTGIAGDAYCANEKGKCMLHSEPEKELNAIDKQLRKVMRRGTTINYSPVTPNIKWEEEFDESFPEGEYRTYNSYPFPIEKYTRDALKEFIGNTLHSRDEELVREVLGILEKRYIEVYRKNPEFAAGIVESQNLIKELLKNRNN